MLITLIMGHKLKKGIVGGGHQWEKGKGEGTGNMIEYIYVYIHTHM
jgi:hypothetical protein